MSDDWKLSKVSAGVFIAVAGTVIANHILNISRGDANYGSDRETSSVSESTHSVYPSVTPTESDYDSAVSTEDAYPLIVSDEATGNSSVVSLADLGEVDSSYDVDIDEAIDINGESYNRSIVYTCFVYCDDSSPAYIEYNLGREYSRFTAVVGVDDNTDNGEQVGVFRAYGDGELLEERSAGLGEPSNVDIAVDGVLRLRLEWETTSENPDPMQAGIDMAGGVSYVLPDLVWGTPTLYR